MPVELDLVVHFVLTETANADMDMHPILLPSADVAILLTLQRVNLEVIVTLTPVLSRLQSQLLRQQTRAPLLLLVLNLFMLVLDEETNVLQMMIVVLVSVYLDVLYF